MIGLLHLIDPLVADGCNAVQRAGDSAPAMLAIESQSRP